MLTWLAFGISLRVVKLKINEYSVDTIYWSFKKMKKKFAVRKIIFFGYWLDSGQKMLPQNHLFSLLSKQFWNKRKIKITRSS